MWTARLLVLASLFAPAALGESLKWGCVWVDVWTCRRRHANTPLVFCHWRRFKAYQFFFFFFLLLQYQIPVIQPQQKLLTLSLIIDVYLAPAHSLAAFYSPNFFHTFTFFTPPLPPHSSLITFRFFDLSLSLLSHPLSWQQDIN